MANFHNREHLYIKEKNAAILLAGILDIPGCLRVQCKTPGGENVGGSLLFTAPTRRCIVWLYSLQTSSHQGGMPSLNAQLWLYLSDVSLQDSF